jgi:large subunit ribosomal protein L23
MFQQNPLYILRYPILTPKTIELCKQNTYSFSVDVKADKLAIKLAVKQLFGVDVISVNTSRLAVKTRRRKWAPYKKAIIKLAPPDFISLFERTTKKNTKWIELIYYPYRIFAV